MKTKKSKSKAVVPAPPSHLAASLVELIRSRFSNVSDDDLAGIKEDDDIACIAYWDNGYNFSSCKRDKWEDIAHGHAIEGAGPDDGYETLYIDMDTNTCYRARISSVTFEED